MAAVDVEVRAVLAGREARHGGVHGVVVTEDLDPPRGRVPDHLALSGQHDAHRLTP